VVEVLGEGGIVATATTETEITATLPEIKTEIIMEVADVDNITTTVIATTTRATITMAQITTTARTIAS